MCGIYGYQVPAGEKLSTYEASVLNLVLGSEMESRGRESFGAALWLPDQNEPEIIKSVGKITEKGAEIFRKAAEVASQVLVHTRQSTTGKVVAENSHPFRHGDILGVHNGIVHNHLEMKFKYGREDVEVDSQHIFMHINDNLPTDELEGYGTIAYLRESEGWKRYHIARTTGGSLCLARLYRGKIDYSLPEAQRPRHTAVAFASTTQAIRKAVDLLGWDMRIVSDAAEEYYLLEDGEIFKGTGKFLMNAKRTAYGSRTSGGSGSGPTHNHSGSTSGGEWNRRRTSVVNALMGKGGSSSSSSHETHMTKRQRREARKAERRRRMNLEEPVTNQTDLPAGAYSCTPFPSAVRDNSGYPKIYREVGTKDETYSMMCPDSLCRCDLDQHVWGRCSSTSGSCMVSDSDLGCTVSAPICNQCGCFLIKGIHHITYSGDKAKGTFCKICNQSCFDEKAFLKEFTGRVNSNEEAAKAIIKFEEQRASQMCNYIERGLTMEIAQKLLAYSNEVSTTKQQHSPEVTITASTTSDTSESVTGFDPDDTQVITIDPSAITPTELTVSTSNDALLDSLIMEAQTGKDRLPIM